MEERQLEEVLSYYFDGKCKIKEGPSGMNNLTRYVDYQGKRYVVRVYKNHCDEKVVEMEHLILKKLSHLSVPHLVEMKNGGTLAKMNQGLVSVFHYKEGVNLELKTPTQYYNLGETVGQLSLQLKGIKCHNGEYLPYYKLNESYPNHGAEQFCNDVSDNFRDVKEELQRIGQLLEEVHTQKVLLEKLPHQLIHGDINCSNLLMDDEGKISAILDFEFVTQDLRAMEVAICLSELLHEIEGQFIPEFELFLNSFCAGYSLKINLTHEEIEVLPFLILLRRLDVFLHFLDRYKKGIETENMNPVTFLKKQIKSIAFQDKWLLQNGNQIQKLFMER